jgi:GT2 family glycosyltransferase
MKPAIESLMRGAMLPAVHLSDVPLVSEEEQRSFFEASQGCALAAEAKSGTVERWFNVAGAILRICFAGERLVECLAPALAHLEIPAAARADAVFHVWDSESTGVAMAPPICPRDHFSGRGDIWSMVSPRFKSAFLSAEVAVALMDVETATGVFWIHSASELPYWATASPMRNLFHWWMESRGCQLVHGAAIGVDGKGVLITGKGGLGKSTTALACLDAGLQYIADDFLVVEPGPAIRVHSLYSTGKLEWSQMARFPRFAGLAKSFGSPQGDKAVLYLYPAFAGQLVRSLSLKAILTPGVVNRRESGVRPISRPVLERATGFTTLTLLPHAGRHTMAFIERFVASLPGLRLDLGFDIAAIPSTIKALVEKSPADLAALADRDEAFRADRPLVSVIVPMRNGASFLPQAVASIQAQNYPALEIIVVDDGSTDDIAEVLARLPATIRYLRQEPSGPSAARNRGIREANGEFIAFLDVDDLWPPDSLHLMVEAMIANPGLDVVQGYAQIMRQMPETGQYEFIGCPLEVYLDYLGGGLYRRSAFDKVGLLDESLSYCEDLDWFYRARDGGLVIQRLDQISLFVRRHAQNMTRDYAKREHSLFLVAQKIMAQKRLRASLAGLGPAGVGPAGVGPAGARQAGAGRAALLSESAGHEGVG